MNAESDKSAEEEVIDIGIASVS